MSLLGTPNTGTSPSGGNRTDIKEKFTTAYGLFTTGFIADSYIIFKELAPQKHPAVFVNLALCHMKVGEFSDALQSLDAAAALLSKTDTEKVRSDATYSKLQKIQAASDCYLNPMKFETPSLYPRIADETIMRLTADVCVEIGDDQRVERIAATLSDRGYANVERALQRIKH